MANTDLKSLRKQHPVVRGQKLKEYLNHYLRESLYNTQDGFFRVVHPIPAFKLLRDDRIANLQIPADETIYIGPDGLHPNSGIENRKMRASKAFVHSIVDMKTGEQKLSGVSLWEGTFVYRVGCTEQPDRFSWQHDQCNSGIHFYLNLVDALDHE